MDTTLLVAIAVAVVVLLIAGAAAVGTGRFAIAGMGRAGSGRAVQAPSAPASPGGRPASLATSAVLDLPLAPAPDAVSPFAPPSAPAPVPATPAAHQAEIAVERMQARIDARLDALERDMRTRLDALGREIAASRDATGPGAAAFEAKQAAAFREFRAELAPLLNRAADGQLPLARERRADASGDLYAMVARLESAISQVTNPVLLPGEAYAPPVEFFAEALAWENWKDVGERAFALAESFSARRLYLSEAATVAVAAFVTTLRGVLTRSVYPNLVPDATPQQLDALRSALAALAAEFPKVRRVLEQEFRSASTPGGAAS